MAKYMSLDRFAGGALLERFNLAMRQIVQNIADANADPQKARTLTIKLTFKPDAGRSKNVHHNQRQPGSADCR